jgi:predicted nucleotidyltransferase
MYYEEVFRALNNKGVRYVVVGGIALNLHGVPRATADLDIAVALENENLEKIVEAMMELGFKPRLPVTPQEFSNPLNLEKWKKEKNMKVFTFWNPHKPYEEVDILISNPIKFEELEKTREVVKAKGIEIPIISIDYLIKLKEFAGRKQDESDIEALKKIKRMKEK